MSYRRWVPPLFPYSLIVDPISYFSQYTGNINIPEAIQINAIRRKVQEQDLIGKHYLPIEFHPPTIFHPSGKLNSFVFQVKHNLRSPEEITVHMKDGVLGYFRQMYYPKEFDAHPSYVPPTALQPGAIVAYKLDTRIKDVWVLAVALNSCPTLGKSYKKPHHLQLQTLQTIYDFEEDDNRIITYPANETYQLDIDFNTTFDFDPNQL